MLSTEFAEVLRDKIAELEASLIAVHEHAVNSLIVDHEDREREFTQQLDRVGKLGKRVQDQEEEASDPDEDSSSGSVTDRGQTSGCREADTDSDEPCVRVELPGLTLSVPGEIELHAGRSPSKPMDVGPTLAPAQAPATLHCSVTPPNTACSSEKNCMSDLLPLVPEASPIPSGGIAIGSSRRCEGIQEEESVTETPPGRFGSKSSRPSLLRRFSLLRTRDQDQAQDPPQKSASSGLPRRFSLLRVSGVSAVQFRSESSRTPRRSQISDRPQNSWMQRLESSSSATPSALGGPQGFDVLNVWKNVLEGGQPSTTPMTLLKSKTTVFDYTEETDNEDRSVTHMFEPYMFEPNSMKRIVWDLIGLVLIFLDGVLLPLQLFDPPESEFTSTVFWIARIFWTADLPLSFITGILMPDGNVNMNPKLIAKAYCRTWLLPDITIVSLDWSEVLMTAFQGGTGTGGTVRGLRLIRITRVARVIKLPQLVRFFDERVRSERLMLLLSVFKITLFILGLAHVVACLWYGLGTSSDDETWVKDQGLTGASLYSKYLHAFHWSITQYVGGMDEILPQNLMERLFNVTVIFCTFVVSACFVSSITSSLTRLHIIAGKRSGQFSALRRFLCDRGVSGETMVRVQRNAQHALLEKQRNVPEGEVELLSFISEPLLVEIHFEEHSPILKTHPFFALYLEMNPAGMRKLCHSGVSLKTISKGDVLFSSGEIPAHPAMHCCCGGMLSYQQNTRNGRMMKVTKGTWISEAVLWVSWTHQGLLRASTDHCRLLTVNAATFQKIASQFQNLEFHPGLYACCFAERLREQSEDEELTDITSSNMAEDIVTNAYYQDQNAAAVSSPVEQKARVNLARASTHSRHSITSGFDRNTDSQSSKGVGFIRRISTILNS